MSLSKHNQAGFIFKILTAGSLIEYLIGQYWFASFQLGYILSLRTRLMKAVAEIICA